MKQILYLSMALLLAATSCQDDEPVTEAASGQGIRTIIAEIPAFQPQNDAKSYINGEASTIQPLWSEGDAIKVFTTTGESAVFVLNANGVGKSKARFSLPDATKALSGTFACAYYPADQAISYTDGTGITATIPAVQAYVKPAEAGPGAGTFAPASFPMVGYGMDVIDQDDWSVQLGFKNVFGILQLNFTGTEAIKQIDVLSSSQLHGTATITPGTTPSCTITDGAGYLKLTTTSATRPVLADVPTAFYIAIPPATLSDIYITTTTDLLHVQKNIQIRRNVIKDMAASTLEAAHFTRVSYSEAPEKTPAIVDGTVWAPVNCGYDATHTYGMLYQFGRMVGGGYDASEDKQTVVAATYDASGYNKNPDDTCFYQPSELPYDWYCNINNKKDPSVLLPSWPIKSTDPGYVAGKIGNPCPEGWRVPTIAELCTLGLHASTSELTADAGQNGYFLSGTAETSDDVPQVFLPAGGSLNRKGEPLYRGTVGNYWSQSVVNSAGTQTIDGQKMAIPNSRGSMRRCFALSVRCVKD